MNAVDYQIEMLNVGSADALIIYYIDEYNKGRLVLVDAGNYSDGQTIIDHIYKYYSISVIDLAIVTHPDDDHYGGFIKMLEKLSDGDGDAIRIEKFWINDPGNNHVDKNEVKWITKQHSVNVRARSVYDLIDHDNLIDLIDSLSISRSEKFAEIFESQSGRLIFPSTDRYTCFKIIGPTKNYYEKLVPDFRNDELNFFAKEDDSSYSPRMDIQNGNCLSPTLDQATDDTSVHNQSSIIFLFEPENGDKYLFMGDAGRYAFNNIPNHLKNKIKGVRWLKVPHHGSKHNLDSAMINWIKPKTTYISTERIGNYLSQCTVNALKRVGCSVYSTHKEKSSFLHKGIWKRDGYSTAIPL
jgi:beta-lactamase superfamily II metal-dependent hydrolase